ncbi:hypothetical protein BC833DRAFT_573809 [Globomyces pollinis-pini]|nr:hypothetical protein BC833DRAFT_573809 [Globomyces pollinis-pini]
MKNLIITVTTLLQWIHGSPIHEEFPLFVSTTPKRLISTAPGQQTWMTEEDIMGLYQTKTKFIDVTDGDFDKLQAYSAFKPKSTPNRFPTTVSHKDFASRFLSKVDLDRLETFLTKLSSFQTRYYKSKYGQQSAQWIYESLEKLASDYPRSNVHLIVTKFQHSWNQFSIICRFENVEKKFQPVVILSAHQDSVNQWNPWFGRSPGADDDGSGTATIFETLFVLWNNDFVPDRPLEFHFYSAEEGGLLGSQKVVADYMRRDVQVYGVFHNDMTGYQPDGLDPVIGISTDNVDPVLSKTLQIISESYAGVEWIDTKCGYGCSDHASWTQAGVPAVFTFEAAFKDQSPFIHSSDDTVKHVTFEHMQSFVNNCIGFAIEMSLYNGDLQ